jgi:hypothetical protein
MVAIINSVNTRYLTLVKVGQSTFALEFLFMFNCISSASLFVASLFFVIYLLLFVILSVVLNSHSFVLLNHFKFVSVSVYSVFIRLSIIQLLCVIVVLILKMCTRYFNPHNNKNPESQ